MPETTYEMLAREARALAAACRANRITPKLARTMTDALWGRVAAFVGRHPPSQATKDLVIRMLEGDSRDT